MKKENKSNIHVVPQLKGGAGKTTFSNILSAIIFLNEKSKVVNQYEIDDNNESSINSNFIIHKSLKLKDSETTIDDIQFASMSDENSINIIDCGGGNDTKLILEKLQEIDLRGLSYYIPINDDTEQVKNVKDTISLILDFDNSAEINLILNRCTSLSETEIKKQFINIFGSDELGIPSQLDELKINNIFYIPNSPIFSILKSHFKVSLLDSYISSKDLVQNIDEYRQKWIQEGKESFMKNNRRYRFAKMVIELMNQLEPLQKALK